MLFYIIIVPRTTNRIMKKNLKKNPLKTLSFMLLRKFGMKKLSKIFKYLRKHIKSKIVSTTDDEIKNDSGNLST